MVATKGKGWVLAASAVRAVQEADRIAPNRSRASDGSIGDQAHAARESFHNPYGGFVDAVDITHDPRGGFDAHAHADGVVVSRPDHLDHLISNRRIASAARGWVWRPYTGSNPHDKHIHIANKRNDAGRHFAGRLFAHQEDDMDAVQDARLTRIEELLMGSIGPALGRCDARTAKLVEDDLDEAAIAALVLAGLDPKAIAAAIPADLADKVADELASRLKA